jgi:hypothetical protein
VHVTRRLWAALLVLGVLMIPVGVVWMAYAITQTDTTATGTSVSVWPIVAFFVAFIGGTVVTVASIGWMFSWFTGDDDADDMRTSQSETLANAVPTTRVGWGGDAPEAPPR